MILKKRHIFFLLLPLICCNTQLAVSQEIPPQAKAGAADRKLEKPEPLIFDKGPKKLMLPRDKRILVKKFVVEKNGIISEERLDNLFAPYLNKELDLHKLEWVCDLVSIEYHEKGYFLARAVLPEQEIKDGVVRIVILDGTITTKDIGEFESEPELEYKPKRRSTYKPKASAKPKRKSIGAKQDKPKPKLKPRPKHKRRPKPR